MVQNLSINKDEFTEEQINQLIEDNNITIKLTNKRKKLLAVLLHLNGLDDKDEQGRFFIDNIWLSQFVGMTETNLLVALRYLKRNGIIERETGSNHRCSRYKIINSENNSTNQKTVVQNNSIDDKNNSTNQKTVVQNNSIDDKNNSRDRDIDKDIDIESDSESYKNSESDIYNIINNIIKDNINNLINIIEEKENNIINIIKEKEKTSSIENNNKKEKDTLMEETLQEQINQLKEQNNQLQEQINELKEQNNQLKEQNNQQNEILTARLNSAAKQFKVMMRTIRELQQKNNSLEEQINQLKKENKKEQSPTVQGSKEQNKTINVEVKPSTAFCGDAVEAKKELSPTVKEGINETFDVEQIVGLFKDTFKDPQVARQREVELLKEFKENNLSYGNRRDLELRLNKYIKSLELSMDKEEVPQEVQKPIEEVKKEETIPTVDVEVAQVPIQEEEQKELSQETIKEVEEAIASRKEDKATEGKESTFVDSFQEVKSNCTVGQERLRYQDLKTKVFYSSIDEAKAANVNPMFLYDNEVKRSVFSYQ